MATQLKNDTVFDSANSGDTAEECELSDLDEHYAVIDHLQRETSVLQEWNDVVETLTSELEMAQIAIEELRREKQTLLDELTANKNVGVRCLTADAHSLAICDCLSLRAECLGCQHNAQRRGCRGFAK